MKNVVNIVLALSCACAARAGEAAKPSVTLAGDGFVAHVAANGHVTVAAPDGRALMVVNGFDMKWEPVRAFGGRIVDADTDVDAGRASVALDLVAVDKESTKKTPAEGYAAAMTVAVRGRMIAFRYDLTAPNAAKTGGVMVGRALGAGLKGAARETAKAERAANPAGELARAVPGPMTLAYYTGRDARVFELLWGNANWKDPRATHLKGVKIGDGAWRFHYVLVVEPPAATPADAVRTFEADGAAP